MKKHIRIMLGKGGCFVEECLNENYIGASFDIEEDLTGKLSNIWQEFNKEYIPVFFKKSPRKDKNCCRSCLRFFVDNLQRFEYRRHRA